MRNTYAPYRIPEAGIYLQIHFREKFSKIFERLGNDTVQPGSTRLSEGFERISKSYYPYRVASLDKFGRVVESHRV